MDEGNQMIRILIALVIFIVGIILLCMINFVIQKYRDKKKPKFGFQIKKEGKRIKIIPEDSKFIEKIIND